MHVFLVIDDRIIIEKRKEKEKNVCLFGLHCVEASFITAQPGFCHCTNVVYHCASGKCYPHILGTATTKAIKYTWRVTRELFMPGRSTLYMFCIL